MTDFLWQFAAMVAFGLGFGGGVALGFGYVVVKFGLLRPVVPTPAPAKRNDPHGIVRRTPPEPKGPIPRDPW